MFNIKFTYRFFLQSSGIALLYLLIATFAQAQNNRDTLPTVTVSSIKYADVTTSPVPVQQLTKKELATLNSMTVADAVKYFSGVQVKDYGGVGGLKTISVRSLGANHTGVMYDGIMLSDAQGGQIDLGKLSLDNIESISLYNAQPTELLLPARSFASANVLMLRSSFPDFYAAKKWNTKVTLKAGSFGFFSPSVNIRYQANKNFYNTLSAEWQRTDGAYPFKAYEAGGATVKRINSDVNAFRAEYDAGFRTGDSDIIKFKTYYYRSERGLPGGIILYNSTSDDRLTDRNFFTQASWKKTFSYRSALLLNAKYVCNYNYYIDPGYPNAQGKLENKFNQKEYYVSAVYAYKISKILSASYAADYFVTKLSRSDDFAQGFAMPERNTLLNNVAVIAAFKKIEIQGDLLYTHLQDKVQTGPNAKRINSFSPTIAVSYAPSGALPVRIRVFYKDEFRAPTFNDLYYTNVGNTALRPEYAKQYNLGITYNYSYKGFIQTALVTVDGYYNKVTDKILAVPRGQNLFQWTMLNIGRVEVKGIDAAIQLYAKKINDIDLAARFAYTFQQARDVSDKNSALYKTQLPYTPENSGSININAGYKKINLGYNVLLSGYRYLIGEPIPDNLVKEWATQDVSISYTTYSVKGIKYKALLELNNIFNRQYEIIKYYPMPRSNYRIGLTVAF